MVRGDVMIRLRDVGLSYRVREGLLRWSKHTPLKSVSFDVYKGETIGIIGRNGAGKSTLLRLIAGIYSPDHGTVENHGAHTSLLLLRSGFVQHMTGRQNAMLTGMLMGIPRREMAARMDAIAEFAGIGEFMDYPMSTYSAGMWARLGFSVAVQSDSDVMLVDEVLGVGDAEFREKSTAEMKKLVTSDKTVVLVSHVLASLRELCNRVVWIEDGVVKMCGETEEVLTNYERPKG